MANLITSFRFMLVFVLVAMIYLAPPAWQLVNPLFLIFIITLDAIDGYVARRRGENTVFGSVYDIAVDRVVENILWIVLADMDLVPVWVALVFVTRGLLVDSIRGQAANRGVGAFEMMRSPLGRFLVAGRFMRGFYGTLKAVTFAWILLFQPVPVLFPDFWAQWAAPLGMVSLSLVYFSVIICLVRGIPVFLEFYRSEGTPSREHLLR
jgi:CDP-diacylglycerol--glycerol-3-phosphate 3-phosphatidyltransferase